MANLTAFLDANILFSASLGSKPFELLWKLAKLKKIELLTNYNCIKEAQDNLERKRPHALKKFEQICKSIKIVPGVSGFKNRWVNSLPDNDQPVLATTLYVGADVLITGDVKDFGHLMGRKDLPIWVCTVRDFLIYGANYTKKTK